MRDAAGEAVSRNAAVPSLSLASLPSRANLLRPMWLLPIFSAVSSAAGRVFYRLRVDGPALPEHGPALIVANHPNSLLDPVLVAGAAGRRVRFLAKAPLFSDKMIGWIVRGSGAIPVYRRVDDPEQTARNQDMFRAVYQTLGEGAAIGIFPEGITHGEPELAPLKTGAARIALGTCARFGSAFPIIPFGLVFRDRDRFRSEALVVRGPPIDWDDLSGRHEEDREAVRELTDRIDRSLRHVTLNLERWEDRPLVEWTEAIWASEFGGSDSPTDRVTRLARVSDTLRAARRFDDGPATGEADHWSQLAQRITTFGARVSRLGLDPSDLTADIRFRTAIRWALRRVYMLGVPLLVTAVLGYILFWIPRNLTAAVVGMSGADDDRRATYTLLIGIAAYGVWIALVAITAAQASSALWGIAIALGLPALGIGSLWIRERWRGAWADSRRFMFLRNRPRLVEYLLERRCSLAQEMRAFYDGRTQESR